MGYANLANAFAYKGPLFSTKADQLAENDAWLKNNNWQDGTKAVFFQASPPTGWTQDAANNDYALRVVSGIGGGTGGSQSLATNISFSHLHTLTDAPDHVHGLQNHIHYVGHNSITSYSEEGIDALGNVGNVVMRSYRVDGTPGSNQEIANFLTVATHDDDTGRSSAGTHTHAFGTSLTDTSFAYVDIIFATKDSGSGYTDETGSFSHNAKIIYDTFANLEANDNYLLGRITAFGAKMVFFQAAAPTGWTQATTQNDKMLRIVSGAGGGTGGIRAISAALSLVHNHSNATDTGHVHASCGNHRHDLAVKEIRSCQPTSNFFSNGPYYAYKSGLYFYGTDGSAVTRDCLKGRTQQDGDAASSTSFSHNHNIGTGLGSIQPAYMDVIEASKNAAGSPYTFQDLTGAIVYKGLVSKQKLNNHGRNDEYLKYHTMPSSSKSVFFQATAPLTWTQSVVQNDRCLRMTTGAGGGIGGSNLISVGFPLAHTHSVDSRRHSHQFNHTHNFELGSQSNAGNQTPTYDGPFAKNNNNMTPSSTFSTGFSIDAIKQEFQAANTTLAIDSHNHGGTSQSSLGTVILKYADVILCAKD